MRSQLINSKRFPIAATVLSLSLALAGCVTPRGLHTTGKTIDVNSLPSKQSLAGVTLSPTAWPAQDWWVGFGDPQLTTLINEALKNNPTLDEAEARARQAQAVAAGIDAARMPQGELDASVIGSRLSEKDPLYPAYDLGFFAWAKSVTAGFSWDLDLWGGKRDAWEAALGRSRAVEIEARAARIQLSVNVARAYVSLGYAFAEQEVAERELQRANKALELTRRLLEGGLGTPQQEFLADSQAASAEQQKVQADRAIDAARSALSVLLGEGPDRGLSITRPHLLNADRLALPENMQADLIGRRTDLVAARWLVEAASKDIKAARTEFLPDVNLSAMAGFVALGGSVNVLQLPARTYTIAPALSLPIFDGGRLRANLAGANATYDEAVARYNGLLIHAVNEVSDIVSALNSVRAQIALEQRAQQDAAKSYDDALSEYKGGISGQLTPVITRQQLLLTEQRLAALESQQADLSVRLIDALGGGYETQAVAKR